jgi:hypothetical protein
MLGFAFYVCLIRESFGLFRITIPCGVLAHSYFDLRKASSDLFPVVGVVFLFGWAWRITFFLYFTSFKGTFIVMVQSFNLPR